MVDRARVKSILESLIFISEEPLGAGALARIVEGAGRKQIEELLDELTAEYKDAERGLVLVRVAEGYQFRTPEANAEWVRRMLKVKPARLTKAMIETLAIVAYNQPATGPEVENVRGVDCSSALKSLLDRQLLKIVGRKDAPGKPLLYGTTKTFLETFGLPDLSHLPSLKEIEELIAVTGDRELIAKSGIEEGRLSELSEQAKRARTELSRLAREGDAAQQDDIEEPEAAQPDPAEPGQASPDDAEAAD